MKSIQKLDFAIRKHEMSIIETKAKIHSLCLRHGTVQGLKERRSNVFWGQMTFSCLYGFLFERVSRRIRERPGLKAKAAAAFSLFAVPYLRMRLIRRVFSAFK